MLKQNSSRNGGKHLEKIMFRVKCGYTKVVMVGHLSGILIATKMHINKKQELLFETSSCFYRFNCRKTLPLNMEKFSTTSIHNNSFSHLEIVCRKGVVYRIVLVEIHLGLRKPFEPLRE